MWNWGRLGEERKEVGRVGAVVRGGGKEREEGNKGNGSSINVYEYLIMELSTMSYHWRVF